MCRPRPHGRQRRRGPDHHVRFLADLDGADACAEAHQFGRHARHRGERRLRRQAVVVRLGRLPHQVARVEDGMVGLQRERHALAVQTRGAVHARVPGFELEAPEIGERRDADPGRAQHRTHLPRLERVVDRRDLHTRLAGDAQQRLDIVDFVAMHVQPGPSTQQRHQRQERPVRRLGLLAARARLRLLGEGFLGRSEAVAQQPGVAHAGRRDPPLAAVDTLGVLAHRHLELHRRVEPRHIAHRRAPQLHDHALPAHDIGAAGQDQRRRHAAAERAGDRGVFRVEAVDGTDEGRERRSRLVAVVVRAGLGRRVDAEVRVQVDQAGRDHAPTRVDDPRPLGRL